MKGTFQPIPTTDGVMRLLRFCSIIQKHKQPISLLSLSIVFTYSSLSLSRTPSLSFFSGNTMHRFLQSSFARLVPTGTYLLHSSVVPSYRYFSRFAGDDDVDDGGDDPQPWKSMEGLRRCSANHVPLSPITFLERAAKVYRDRTSLVYGCRNFTWNQTHQRCLKLASTLSRLGISRGDVVRVFFKHLPLFLFFFLGSSSSSP